MWQSHCRREKQRWWVLAGPSWEKYHLLLVTIPQTVIASGTNSLVSSSFNNSYVLFLWAIVSECICVPCWRVPGIFQYLLWKVLGCEKTNNKPTIFSPWVRARAYTSTWKCHCSFCQTEFQRFSQQGVKIELKLWQFLSSCCVWDQGTIINHQGGGGCCCHSPHKAPRPGQP